MTIQSLKRDIADLKEAVNVKQALPWDCKSLMMRWKEESTRRSIIQKLYAATGEAYKEPGPIELNYSNYESLSWQASEFLKMSDEEKAAAVEKEFPPKQYTEQEAEEIRRQFIAKINGIGERMRHNNTTA